MQIGKQKINTSSHSQSGKIIFGNRETGRIVSGNTQIVPGSRFQIQNNVVIIGFDIIRYLIPFGLFAEREIPVEVIKKCFEKKTKFFFCFVICCSDTNRFLFSTTKCDMGQPPSFQALKCSETELDETSMKRCFSGSLGL